MKAFQFSLQKILEIREKEEDLKKKFFGQCRRDFLESQDILFHIEGQKEECIQRSQVLIGDPIDLHQRETYNQYLGFLRKKIHVQREELKFLEEKMDEARDDWVNKRKERMILERLKERREKVYLKEVLREEQYILDDIAITHRIDAES